MKYFVKNGEISTPFRKHVNALNKDLGAGAKIEVLDAGGRSLL